MPPAHTLKKPASAQTSWCSSGPGNLSQLTRLRLGAARPLALWLGEAARAKLARRAGFTLTGAAVALTAGTQVVVAVGRLPPEKKVVSSVIRVGFRAEVLGRLPSVDKRAGLLWRLRVVGWNSVQLTGDVELQERRGWGGLLEHR